MFKLILNVLAMIVGVVLLGTAFFYWNVPAGSLLPILPGYTEGSSDILREYSIISAILGSLVFMISWIISGTGKKKFTLAPEGLTRQEDLKL
ncbi:hypothetical protein HZC00_05545 [Candidatus Kaiserbacteria bacterium]|nr:hypothetical protein [Candidatus Kaiserbacteria bacterium]